MTKRIEAAALTTFDISSDGEAVQLNVRNTAGEDAALVLPTGCVNQLLLTLPRIIQAALRRGRNDDSLRLAHPLERFEIEVGERNVEGEVHYILTLHTDRDFHVSFAAPKNLLGRMAFSIVEEVLERPLVQNEERLNS